MSGALIELREKRRLWSVKWRWLYLEWALRPLPIDVHSVWINKCEIWLKNVKALGLDPKDHRSDRRWAQRASGSEGHKPKKFGALCIGPKVPRFNQGSAQRLRGSLEWARMSFSQTEAPRPNQLALFSRSSKHGRIYERCLELLRALEKGSMLRGNGRSRAITFWHTQHLVRSHQTHFPSYHWPTWKYNLKDKART